MLAIIEWNRERNGLNFDPSLETYMLSEVAQAFFRATTTVKRLREAARFEFIFIGTQAKFYAQQFKGHREAMLAYTRFKSLQGWASDIRKYILKTLEEELDALGFASYSRKMVIGKCLEFVLEANTNGSNSSEMIEEFLSNLLEEMTVITEE